MVRSKKNFPRYQKPEAPRTIMSAGNAAQSLLFTVAFMAEQQGWLP